MRIRGALAGFGLVLAGAAVGLLLSSHTGSPLAGIVPTPARRLAQAEAKLDAVVSTIEFRKMSLAQAVAALQEQTGANLVIDWPAVESAGVDRESPIDLRLRDVTLEQALIALIHSVPGDITFTIHDGLIVITTEDGLARYAYAAVYDVRDIKLVGMPSRDFRQPHVTGDGRSAGAPMSREDADEEILAYVESMINGIDRAPVAYMCSGRLFVVGAWRLHRQVARVLDQFLDATEQ